MTSDGTDGNNFREFSLLRRQQVTRPDASSGDQNRLLGVYVIQIQHVICREFKRQKVRFVGLDLKELGLASRLQVTEAVDFGVGSVYREH